MHQKADLDPLPSSRSTGPKPSKLRLSIGGLDAAFNHNNNNDNSRITQTVKSGMARSQTAAQTGFTTKKEALDLEFKGIKFWE